MGLSTVAGLLVVFPTGRLVNCLKYPCPCGCQHARLCVANETINVMTGVQGCKWDLGVAYGVAE